MSSKMLELDIGLIPVRVVKWTYIYMKTFLIITHIIHNDGILGLRASTKGNVRKGSTPFLFAPKARKKKPFPVLFFSW